MREAHGFEKLQGYREHFLEQRGASSKGRSPSARFNPCCQVPDVRGLGPRSDLLPKAAASPGKVARKKPQVWAPCTFSWVLGAPTSGLCPAELGDPHLGSEHVLFPQGAGECPVHARPAWGAGRILPRAVLEWTKLDDSALHFLKSSVLLTYLESVCSSFIPTMFPGTSSILSTVDTAANKTDTNLSRSSDSRGHCG